MTLAVAGMLGVGFVAAQIHAVSDGDTSLFRFLLDPATAGSRSVHYSDATAQKLLKEGLTRAGIPFRTRTREGREYVVWEQQHDAAADKVVQDTRWDAVRAGIPLNPRASFNDPAEQKDFIAWLGKRGVKYDTFKLDGRDYVAWEFRSDTPNLMDVYMAERKRN
jgi:hypothetical protein